MHWHLNSVNELLADQYANIQKSPILEWFKSYYALCAAGLWVSGGAMGFQASQPLVESHRIWTVEYDQENCSDWFWYVLLVYDVHHDLHWCTMFSRYCQPGGICSGNAWKICCYLEWNVLRQFNQLCYCSTRDRQGLHSVIVPAFLKFLETTLGFATQKNFVGKSLSKSNSVMQKICSSPRPISPPWATPKIVWLTQKWRSMDTFQISPFA